MLGVCEGCRRFARGEECPFCGARVGVPRSLPPGRRTRAGVLVAATAVSLAGCSSPAVLYGIPPIDASEDRTFDDAQPLYGCPPPYCGPMDSGPDGDATLDAKDASDTGSDAKDGGG